MNRTLAIGDIHGCLDALKTLLQVVAPTEDDHVVFLGDCVDRGPDSKGVLDLIMDLQAEAPFRISVIMGNHELMMIRSTTEERLFSSWYLSFGGYATLRSFGLTDQDQNWPEQIPTVYWEFMRNTLPYVETDSHIFVHASVDAELPMSEQSDEWLLWTRCDRTGRHISGKPVICGHTAQTSGEVLARPHMICIDTYPLGQWLTCYCAETREYWQASLTGQTRTGQL